MIEKLAKLQEGQVFKNYKELCRFLDIEPANGGRNVKLQSKELQRYFSFSKQGQKITIESIYSNPLKKVDLRNNFKINYSNFNVSEKDEHAKGVYCITKDNDIYIGSTFSKEGFRGRFKEHLNPLYKNKHLVTNKMLSEGGSFSVLWSCADDNIEDEFIVRYLEQFFIHHFKNNTSLKVVNKNFNTYQYYTGSNLPSITNLAFEKGWAILGSADKVNTKKCKCLNCGFVRNFHRNTIKKSSCICTNCKNKRIKSNRPAIKNIKVSEKDYDKAIKILLENNINIVNK